jgi:hypothetical protein
MLTIAYSLSPEQVDKATRPEHQTANGQPGRQDLRVLESEITEAISTY